MKSNLVLSFLCAAISAAGLLSPSILPAQTPQKIEITARRFTYVPSQITVKKGQPVDLILKTEDVPHGLRFREWNLNARIRKGKPTELKFTPDQVGDFVGHCSVFCGSGHGEMTLTVHVVN